jgi:hypothetical protein
MATSNYVGFGRLSTNTSTPFVSCRGWTTLAMHIDNGTGTWTWEFKGVDGETRTILGSANNTSALVFTASNMVNVFFGSDVRVRGTLSSSGGTPRFDYQIMGNPSNREG